MSPVRVRVVLWLVIIQVLVALAAYYAGKGDWTLLKLFGLVIVTFAVGFALGKSDDDEGW